MRHFWSDRRGNIAVLFAFAIVPVIGGIGAAIDYSMASAYRADMQQALDSTALALSKVIPMEQTQLETVAKQYFDASYGPTELTNVKLSVVPEQGKVKIGVTADYTPKIANIFGATKFSVGANAEAVWSMGKVEIALVLDMSLSMQTPDPARIAALRSSTVNLLNVLETAARNPGDAKVGFVPFDGMVNTGYTYATRPNWVRFDWWAENEGSCDKGGHSNKTACQAHYYCTKSQYTSQSSCQSHSGTWKQAVWTGENTSNWNGCVYDRYVIDPADATNVLDYDVLDTDADATYPYNHASETQAQRKTKYPAAKCYSTPPQAMTALSTDWSALRTKANNLTPTGYTNIAIGLIWGWHMLSPTSVFTQGAAYNTDDLTKYIILMTDGYNTKNILMEPSACNTNGPTCPVIDARMEKVCDNIKAVKKSDGTSAIKIYTVRLIAGNADLLRNCATSTNMYYDVQSASGLASVFNAIGAEIASLHLAK
jgi:Flp pilus assembly protein TadG